VAQRDHPTAARSPQLLTADGSFTDQGQLRNKIHAIRPVRNPAYCPRLLAGQSLLLVTGYGPYAGAFFTRRTKCLGVGRS